MKTAQEFLQFRKASWIRLNQLCEEFYFTPKGLTRPEICLKMNVSFELAVIIQFVLSAFSQPKDPSKARRKDGSHIAAHSLQLFESAWNFFGIDIMEVYDAVLIHDVIEDTLVTGDEIGLELGDRTAELANLMTEEVQWFSGMLGSSFVQVDKDRGSIVRFVRKLKTGGKVIAIAEILDRIDDISDLKYLEDKLAKGGEDRDKALVGLIKKFGKCCYTVHELTEESSDVRMLKQFFDQLMHEQVERLNHLERDPNRWIVFHQIMGEADCYRELESVV
ncbi:MAG: hypothetical protein NTY66_03825 [Candidatus Vogelbacteria bacterium]|nr:hypothetical protein [Candidatus Vogelbacteria bacterium]